MRDKLFLIFASLAVILIATISSCNEPVDDRLGEITVDLTEENRIFLFNTSAARSKARANGVGGPAGFIFRLGAGVFSGQNKKGRAERISPLMTMRAAIRKNAGSNFGRVENETDPSELPDCVMESFDENEDGSYIYVLDFGTGCDFFGEIFKGKLTETGLYREDSFEGTTVYEGFGTNFWEVNGTYNYDGVWDFPENAQDSLEFDWSAEYNYDFDLEETYDDNGETVSVASKGSGKEISNQDGYSVMAQENEFIYGSGEIFTSRVDMPLNLNYACDEEVFIYVTGEESGTYSFEDVSATYSVNYGEGECDNIITVIENGEEFTIDLDEVYNNLEGSSGD